MAAPSVKTKKKCPGHLDRVLHTRPGANRDLTMVVDRTRQPTVSLVGNPKDETISFDALNPLVSQEV
jgi:hypothetical protein